MSFSGEYFAPVSRFAGVCFCYTTFAVMTFINVVHCYSLTVMLSNWGCIVCTHIVFVCMHSHVYFNKIDSGIYINTFFFVSVDRREFHPIRGRHQLAVLRGVRCELPDCKQLAVDAVHRARTGQQDVRRDQVLHARLFSVPWNRSLLWVIQYLL